MKITLDGAKMTSRAAAHGHIAGVLGFPEWYGNNLDALWDMLAASGELELELINAPAMLNGMDSYACRMISVFYEADKENENISFRVV